MGYIRGIRVSGKTHMCLLDPVSLVASMRLTLLGQSCALEVWEDFSGPRIYTTFVV